MKCIISLGLALLMCLGLVAGVSGAPSLVTRLLERPYYFHRTFGFEGYRVINATPPVHADNYNVTRAYGVGVYELGGGWVFPAVPRDVILRRGYNFLFSVWAGGNGEGTLFIQFSYYRGGVERLLFIGGASDPLIKNATEMLWQHRIKPKRLNIREGDRLIIRPFLNVTAAGRFGFGFDCVQYPSYIQDPVETRYFRGDKATRLGVNTYKLDTSQSSTLKSVAVNGEPTFTASSVQYPNADITTQWEYTTDVVPPIYHYTELDAGAPIDDTYVYNSIDDTDWHYDEYSNDGSFALPGGKTVAMVRLMFRVYVSGVSAAVHADLECGVESNGEYFLTSAYLAYFMNKWRSFYVSIYVDPDTLETWTEAAIDAMDFVIKGRSDEFTGDYWPAYCSQIKMQVYYFTDKPFDVCINVWQRTNASLEFQVEAIPFANQTRTYKSMIEEHGNVYQPFLWAHTDEIQQWALAETDGVRVYMKYSHDNWGTWTAVADWLTDPLGATQIDNFNWTVHYYVICAVGTGGFFGYIYWGTSGYNSRIENFSWTAPAAAEWQSAVNWTFLLDVREWVSAVNWTFLLDAREWISVVNTTIQLFTRSWQTVVTWSVRLLATNPAIWLLIGVCLVFICGGLLIFRGRQK